jgi:hypothetical protein
VLLLACVVRADDSTAEALLRAADAPRHGLEEGVMRIHVEVAAKSDRPPAASTLDVYVKGRDRVLCVFRDGKHKDRKILAVEDRVWLLVPGTKNPIPITARERLLGGASVADIARLSFAEDFRASLEPDTEIVDGRPCHVLDLIGAAGSSYASGTLWVDAEEQLARKVRLALASGKEAKEIHFTAYAEEGGRTVLRRMEIHHLLAAERGSVTTLEFVDYDPRSLAAEVFDPVGARQLP